MPRSKLDLGHDGSVPLKTRFIAWWEGYDLSGLKRKRAADGDDPPPPEAADGGPGRGAGEAPQVEAAPVDTRPGALNRWGKPLWSATRIEIAEKTWGQGFITPGGHDYFPYLIKPLGLNPAMTVLDLSAGLGGSTRFMASQYGAWLVGLEGNPLLAENAMARSTKAGMTKQAPVEHYDLEQFYYSKRVDAVFAKELFFRVRNKDPLFDNMHACLKERGQVLFTDYVVENLQDKVKLKGWADAELLEPSLWSVQETTRALSKRQLDVRIAEDITETHTHLILTAIHALTPFLEQHHLSHETKVNLVDELELWARRVWALQHGLKCYRFYALR